MDCSGLTTLSLYRTTKRCRNIRCNLLLKTRQTTINEGEDTLCVVFGTKDKRPRETYIINLERVKYTVNKSIKIVCKQNGKFIDKSNSKQAMNY